MRYNDFEKAFSSVRMRRYLYACSGNKNKAMQIYRYNVQLCEQFYGALNLFEVVLRNAINSHYIIQFSDPNWIKTQLGKGGLLEHSPQNAKTQTLINNLVTSGRYSNDRLVSGVTFGFWPYLFTKLPFRAGGQTLLRIFPGRITGTNQRTVYNELQQIKNFRNRIAHHEPVCFDKLGTINLDNARENYQLLLKYIRFLGYNPVELFWGMNINPGSIIDKIERLK